MGDVFTIAEKFRAHQLRILVATDVMSRGIDVKEINLVINYDVPHAAEDYVHRVGRTARVNAKGEAITLVIPKEMYKLRKIEQLIGAPVPKFQLPFPAEYTAKRDSGKHHASERNHFRRKNFTKK